VRNINALGTQTAFNYLINFGFTTIGEDEAGNAALSLGGLTTGVTNIEVTAAQGAIANGGMLQPTILYTHVIDVNENVVIDNRNLPPTQVLNRNAAYLLVDTMRGVITQGTGGRARFQTIRTMDNMGKTGTTQENRDLYYTGSTPWLSASVWLGHDQPRPMTGHVTGTNHHIQVWRHVMEEVHIALELEPRRFEQPPGFVRANVCGVSGLLPVAGLCNHDPRGSRIRSELFAPGTVPTQSCNIHRAFEVCVVSGQLAGPWCPSGLTTTRIGIFRDRSPWIDVAGNVAIADAAFEVPSHVCEVHDHLNSFDHSEFFGNGDFEIDDEWQEFIDRWLAGYGIADDYGQTNVDETDTHQHDDHGGYDHTHGNEHVTNPAPTPVAIPTPTPTPTPVPTPTPTPMPDRTPIPDAIIPPMAVPEPAQTGGGGNAPPLIPIPGGD
jgi:penicillin-binding protein 1A